jgi:hypothetical protein
LLDVNPAMDVARVREDPRLIEERGFGRRQDLSAKLNELIEGRGS